MRGDSLAKQIEYLCTNISSLSGIPVRWYRHGKPVQLFSRFRLDHDPAELHGKTLLETKQNVEYRIVDYQIYGIVRNRNDRIVVGPIGQFLEEPKRIERAAFELGLSDLVAIKEYLLHFSMIPNMPFESFLLMLCGMNLYLNDETLSVEDVTIAPDQQKSFESSLVHNQTVSRFEEIQPQKPIHNSLAYEQMMLDLIEKGDVDGLKRQFKDSSPGSYGTTSVDFIRHMKNTFIVTTTIVSRAAIRGGLDQEEVFGLSDYYIQQCEQLQSVSEITNLQYFMVLDYAQKVHSLRYGSILSDHVLKAIGHIKKHVTTIRSIEEIANAVYLSHSRLSALFVKETGLSLIAYLNKEKIEEAKRLIAFTKRPLSAISTYLGFSSQSHFNRVFKEWTKMTPGNYRQQVYGYSYTL